MVSGKKKTNKVIRSVGRNAAKTTEDQNDRSKNAKNRTLRALEGRSRFGGSAVEHFPRLEKSNFKMCDIATCLVRLVFQLFSQQDGKISTIKFDIFSSSHVLLSLPHRKITVRINSTWNNPPQVLSFLTFRSTKNGSLNGRRFVVHEKLQIHRQERNREDEASKGLNGMDRCPKWTDHHRGANEKLYTSGVSV